MPVYEYSCKACGHEFEREQRISEAPIKKCPSCGALKARRLISRTSFVLKGGGWYNDLYASPSGKPAAGEEAKPGETKAAASKPAGEAAAAPAGESKADGGDKPAGPSGKGPKKGGKGAKAAA